MYKYLLIPSYNDFNCISLLLEEISHIKYKFDKILIIDDSSSDNYINNIQIYNTEIIIKKLKINLGNQAALSLGLKYIHDNFNKNSLIVIMDGDGEDRVSDIPILVNKFLESNAIVVASRTSRNNSLIFKILYFLYKIVFHFLTGKNINFGNFSVLSYDHISKLLLSNNLYLNIPATILKSKIDVIKIPLQRGDRYIGSSKMNLYALFWHGIKGMIVFGEEILTRIIVICIVSCFLLLLLALIIFLIKLFFFPVPGWASIIILVLGLGLIQFSALAIILLFLFGLSISSTMMNEKSYFEY